MKLSHWYVQKGISKQMQGYAGVFNRKLFKQGWRENPNENHTITQLAIYTKANCNNSSSAITNSAYRSKIVYILCCWTSHSLLEDKLYESLNTTYNSTFFLLQIRRMFLQKENKVGHFTTILPANEYSSIGCGARCYQFDMSANPILTSLILARSTLIPKLKYLYFIFMQHKITNKRGSLINCGDLQLIS